jgi:hypothetical protein
LQAGQHACSSSSRGRDVSANCDIGGKRYQTVDFRGAPNFAPTGQDENTNQDSCLPRAKNLNERLIQECR